jgi:hypothetical protein
VPEVEREAVPVLAQVPVLARVLASELVPERVLVEVAEERPGRRPLGRRDIG